MKKQLNPEYSVAMAHAFVKNLLYSLSFTDDEDLKFELSNWVTFEDVEALRSIVHEIDKYVLDTIKNISDTPSKLERDLIRDYIILIYCNWEYWKQDSTIHSDHLAAQLFLNKLKLKIDSPEAKSIFEEVFDRAMRINFNDEVAENLVEWAKESITWEIEQTRKTKTYLELAKQNKNHKE